MVVYELLGRRNGRSVIRAIQVDRVFEVAVGANDVSSIMGHRSLSGRLQAGRIQPFIDVSGRVDLPGPPEKVIAL
jgi:hypothetical protein